MRDSKVFFTNYDNYFESLSNGLRAYRIAIVSSVVISLNDKLTNLFLNARDKVFLPE